MKSLGHVRDIYNLKDEGLNNVEISRRLKISRKTVVKYLKFKKRKLAYNHIKAAKTRGSYKLCDDGKIQLYRLFNTECQAGKQTIRFYFKKLKSKSLFSGSERQFRNIFWTLKQEWILSTFIRIVENFFSTRSFEKQFKINPELTQVRSLDDYLEEVKISAEMSLNILPFSSVKNYILGEDASHLEPREIGEISNKELEVEYRKISKVNELRSRFLKQEFERRKYKKTGKYPIRAFVQDCLDILEPLGIYYIHRVELFKLINSLAVKHCEKFQVRCNPHNVATYNDDKLAPFQVNSVVPIKTCPFFFEPDCQCKAGSICENVDLVKRFINRNKMKSFFSKL